MYIYKYPVGRHFIIKSCRIESTVLLSQLYCCLLLFIRNSSQMKGKQKNQEAYKHFHAGYIILSFHHRILFSLYIFKLLLSGYKGKAWMDTGRQAGAGSISNMEHVRVRRRTIGTIPNQNTNVNNSHVSNNSRVQSCQGLEYGMEYDNFPFVAFVYKEKKLGWILLFLFLLFVIIHYFCTI